VRLRLTPKETSFYDLFAKAADNLVVGAALLTELLGADKAAGPRSPSGCGTRSTPRTRSPTASTGS
jgi:hypothetical protein